MSTPAEASAQAKLAAEQRVVRLTRARDDLAHVTGDLVAAGGVSNLAAIAAALLGLTMDEVHAATAIAEIAHEAAQSEWLAQDPHA